MHSLWRQLAKISAQTWLYLFIVSSLVCVISLRHNNQTMVKLRDTVYAADKNDGDINGALNQLRDYVYAHMNTNLSSGDNNIKPPIQLKYTYQRLYDAQRNQQQAANQQVYSDALSFCRSTGQTAFDTPCIQDYVVSHGGQDSINVPAGLYEFDFISPRWSPDLAGWSLLLSAALLIIFLFKLGSTKYRNKK